MKRTFFLACLAALTGLALRAHATITVVDYWRMGENDPGASNGTVMAQTADLVGGRTLTAFNGPVYSTNVAAAAADHTGSSLCMSVISNTYATGPLIPNVTDNFGIELWANASTTSGTHCLAYNGDTGTSGWGLYQVGSSFAGLFGGVYLFVVPAPVITNTWTHLALVRDSGTTTFYVNGAAVFTTSFPPNAPAGSFMVGVNNSGGELFSGCLDEVRVFTFAPGQFSINDLLVNVPLCALATSNLVEGPAAGYDSVEMTTTPTNIWTATANSPWLRVVFGVQAGIGSTNVIFTWDANPGATRTGTLSIGSEILTVTQAGGTYVAASPVNRLPVAVPYLSAGYDIGIAVDGQGNVYVPDISGNVIREWQPGNLQAFALTNNILTTNIIKNPIAPYSVAADAAGDLFIVDYNNNAIEERTAANGNLQVLVQPSDGVFAISQLAVDTAGNLYVTDGGAGSIYKWTAATQTYAPLVTGFSNPQGVAVDFAGNLYIADANSTQVTEWTPTGGPSPLVTGLNQPSAVAVDASGNVYIADTGNNALKKWSATTRQVTVLASGLTTLNGTAVDAQQNVYYSVSSTSPAYELARGFVDPSTRIEGALAGSDSLPPVLPLDESLLYPFEPIYTQPLSNIVVSNNVVSFSFPANLTGTTVSNAIIVLGQVVPILQTTTITVTTAADSGPGSLRDATANAASGDTIVFDGSLSGQTILLTNGEIVLDASLTMDASALPAGIQINGNGASRIFDVLNDTTNVLTGLTIANGNAGGAAGGGIENDGNLTLNQCTVASNVTSSVGGGIDNSGELIVNESTFVGNSSASLYEEGGGIENFGTLVVNQSTFTGNSANGGGAIFTESGSLLTVNQSTICSNVAFCCGGGITVYATTGNQILLDSIVAGNSNGDLYFGEGPGFTTSSANLSGINPLLAPLGYYGGPTQTMPPLPGSPAIDAGLDSATNSFATDQRGQPRLSGAHVDIGAVEVQFVPPPANSAPVLMNPALSSVSGSNTFQFAFTNVSGVDFTALTSTNLALPLSDWTVLGNVPEISPGYYQFTYPSAPNSPQSFYRVISP